MTAGGRTPSLTARMSRIMLVAALVWMGLIFYLSHRPALPLPGLFPHQDKLFHAGAYAVLAYLWAGALTGPIGRGANGRQHRQSRRLLLAVLISAGYGLTDEYHQSFIPGRDASLGDWLADTVGAIIGVRLYVIIARRISDSRGTPL